MSIHFFTSAEQTGISTLKELRGISEAKQYTTFLLPTLRKHCIKGMTADTVPLLVRSWKVPLKDATADTQSGSGNLHRACDRKASRSGRPSCCPATRQVAPSRPPGSFWTGPCKVRAQPLPRRRRCPATRHSRGHPKRLREAAAWMTTRDGPKGQRKGEVHLLRGAQMGASQRKSSAAGTPEGGRLNGLGVPFKSRGRTQEPIAALALRPGSQTDERRARPQPGSCAQVALPACGA